MTSLDVINKELDEKPGLISGKLVLLALLLTVLGCTVGWLVANQWVRRSLAISEEPLNYVMRADWPTPPVRHTTMERPISNYLPSGPQEKWKVVELDVLPLEVRITDECAALASSDAFTEPAARDRLAAHVEQHPQLWYPRWLLGQWHQLHGDEAQAEAHFRAAFELAPAALIMPYVKPAGRPAGNLEVGTLIIACDRADGEKIDQTLRLVYPQLSTDVRGRLYLPVHHTILRFAELPAPPGHQCSYGDYQWFEFPGRVAALRPAVVWRTD